MNLSINDFIKLEKLGEGTYGEVYKARNKTTNEIVALKKIKSDNDYDGIQPTTLREISMLKELKHPNIVDMFDTFVERGRLYLVFEFVMYDLKKYMDLQTKHFRLRKIKLFTYQMLEGLLYCHARRILHRDLKPQNILIDPTSEILKLADFGLARAFGTPIRVLTHEVVTLWYRAPEILLGIGRYSTGIDVWALGCIMAELTLLKPIFSGDCEIDQLFNMFQILGTPKVEYWPDLQDAPSFQKAFPQWTVCIPKRLLNDLQESGIQLLMRMLTYNPTERIATVDALRHNFFDGITRDMVPSYGGEFELDLYRRKEDFISNKQQRQTDKENRNPTTSADTKSDDNNSTSEMNRSYDDEYDEEDI